MRETSTILGRAAEQKAVEYLMAQGYCIVARNVRTRFYELDIIAIKNDTLVFLEVKYRQSSLYGGGEAAIGHDKVNRLIKASAIFRADNSRYVDMQPQIDVIVVTGQSMEITHYPNALSVDG